VRVVTVIPVMVVMKVVKIVIVVGCQPACRQAGHPIIKSINALSLGK